MSGSVQTGCQFDTTSRIASFHSDESFLLLQQDVLCIYGQRSTRIPPDVYSALRLLDLGLEECVVETAVTMGYTMPEEFLQLDCSATSKNILNLGGLERFTNLELLDISNSSVVDLTPIAQLDRLQTFSAMNARLADVAPLFNLPVLAAADLSGNPGIPCSDLDQLALGGVSVTADLCASTVQLELGGIGADLVLDESSDRAFVSVPSLQQVKEVSLSAVSITRSLNLPAPPRGIDLSGDGQTLYAALNGVGDIAYVDLGSGSAEIVDVSSVLGDDRTWDIAEVSADRIVVSSNPGSNGIAYIVEVRRDLGNALTPVASNYVIRAAPIFAVSADETAVYVGEGFSPNSLYKLDASQPTLPVVAEDQHGQISGSDNLALSPDGSRIYLRSGQALETTTLTQVASFATGRSAVTADGMTLLVADSDSDSAVEYDIATTAPKGARPWGCDIGNVTAIRQFGDAGVMALGEDLLCYSHTVAYP